MCTVKKIISVFYMVVSIGVMFADTKDQFYQLLKERKYSEIDTLLSGWLESEPSNAEVYVAYFNYYLAQSKETILSIDTDPVQRGDYLKIEDKDTGKILGYIHDTKKYGPEKFVLAMQYLEKGILINQDRLDMYFGKIFSLNEVGDYENAGNVVRDVLIRSKTIENKWLWSDDELLEDSYSVLMDSLNDYYAKWFSAKTKDSLKALKENCQLQIDLYPENIYAYNMLGAYLYYQKDYKSAIETLKKAELLNEKDTVVLENIAYISKVAKDIETAIEYYKKVLKYCKEKDKSRIRKILKELGYQE